MRRALTIALVAAVLTMTGCAAVTPVTPAASGTPAEPAGPAASSCGVERPPADGETRYIPCDYDLRRTLTFARAVIAELPTPAADADADATNSTGTDTDTDTDVTIAALDELASDESFLSTWPQAEYQGATRADDGTIVVSWVAQPATCAIFTLTDMHWTSAEDGELIAGGCV